MHRSKLQIVSLVIFSQQNVLIFQLGESAIKMFASEIKSVPSDERKSYEKQLEKYKTNLQNCRDELSSLSQADSSAAAPSKKEEPAQSKQDDAPKKKKKKPADDEYNEVELAEKKPTSPSQPNQQQQVLKAKKGDVKEMDEIHKVQNETINTLENIVKLNETTIQIGIDTAETLKKQTEKMMEIQDRLDKLGTGAKRAGRELLAFIRGLACNAVIVIIMILVVLAAVICVVVFTILRIIKPDLNVFNPNTYNPKTTSSP